MEFVRLYNEPAGIHLYAYQRVFMRRTVESILTHDGDVITALWSRQCLAGNTVILDRDGTACRIKDHPRAWLTGEGRTVYKVRAQNGFEVRATENHPFLTKDGWKRVDQLEAGDALCVLDEWDLPGISSFEHETTHYVNMHSSKTFTEEFTWSDELGALLGYLTADGYSFRALEMGQSLKFTNNNELYLGEVEKLVPALFPDMETKRYPKGNGFDVLCVSKDGRSSKTNGLRRFLTAMHSDDKFPTAIFSAPRSVIISFLNRLFSSDGCASRGLQLACGNSKVYGHYVQLLLAKLGIDSRVKSPEWMSKSTEAFYRLTIDDKPNIGRFLSIVGNIFGKELACESMDTTLVRWSNRSYERAPDGEDGERRMWSKLISVEEDGRDDVYDIVYPDKGWFIAQGISVHNSGKSEALASLASALCLILPTLCNAFPEDPRLSQYKEGFWIGIFAPKQQQSGIIYERIRQRAERESSKEIYSDPDIRVSVATSRGDQVSWTNGSFVTAQTASEQSNVEGKTYHLVIIDEAQLVSETKVSKEIGPMLAATNGTMAKIGTANALRGNFKKSIIWNVEQEKQGGKRNHFEFPYDVVIMEKKKTYEKTKDEKHLFYEKWVQGELRRLGGNKENEEFRQNFRLLWQEANLTAIDHDALYAAGDYQLEAYDFCYNRRIVAGLDYGRKRDVTILTIAEVEDQPVIDTRSVIRPGDDQPLFYTKRFIAWYEIPGRKWHDILGSAVEALERYSVDTVCADGTGVGDPLSEQLQALIPSIKVVPFVMSHVGNDLVYKLYIQEIEAGRMRYVAGEETRKTQVFEHFLHEHEELLKDRVGVYTRCYAPDGEHDDYCDSGALCCYAASQPRNDDTVESAPNPFYASRRGRESTASRAERYRR